MNKKIQQCQEQSRSWWAVLVVGILMVIAGFAYWLFPIIGYEVASILFGWMLVALGVVQLCVSGGNRRPRNWGWWLAGGILNMFVGFMLIRNITLAELLFPYFIAVVFIYSGVTTLVNAGMRGRRRFRWIHYVNGVILLLIGFLFFEAGYWANMYNVSFLTSLAFIYWGVTLVILSMDMKPERKRVMAE